MKPRFLLLAPVLAAILIAAGCGGSSSSTTEAETSADADGALSKDEWIERADAICLATGERLGPLSEASGALLERPETDETLSRLAHYTRVAAGEVETELEELRELKPPTGDEDAIDAILDGAEANQALVAGYGDAIESDDFDRYQALQHRAQRLKAQVGARARAYGLQVCGVGDE